MKRPTEGLLKRLFAHIVAGTEPTAAWRGFVGSCSRSSSRFWKGLAKLDLGQDLAVLEAWLRKVMAEEPPPTEVNGLWFGLFNPVVDGDQATSCLYLAGSKRFDRSDSDWACNPSYWPKGRYAESRVLRDIYELAYAPRGPQVDGEYFCLWYSMWAVAHLCRRIPANLLGDSSRRAVCVGFDDGDWFVVGTLLPDGFAPDRYEPRRGATSSGWTNTTPKSW